MSNFSNLYEEYYTAVYKYFRKKVGENDAEDLTQQTFVKLLAWIGCIEQIRSKKAFIFKIANSVLCDHFRKKQIIENAISTVSFDELYDYTDNYDFTKEIEASDCYKILSKREKRIVELKMDGYNSAEIGRKLNISASTVRTHLEKIRKKLKS